MKQLGFFASVEHCFDGGFFPLLAFKSGVETFLDEALFDKFLEMLESKGIKPQGGTFVEMPRQHNTKEENAQIKNGETPKSFEENKHKLAQKGLRCVLEIDLGLWCNNGKGSRPYLDVLPAEPQPGNEQAYAGAELLCRGYVPQICEKGYRNHSLTAEQKESSRSKSKVRYRIEHVFGE